MEIKVNDQQQRFYLAGDRWIPAIGHEIQVGKYYFCAIPKEDSVNVSDIISGVKLFDIKMTPAIMAQTTTKKDTMEFLKKMGEVTANWVSSTENFDRKIAEMRKSVVDKLGERPSTEDVDVI
ncbi:hypothetical protein GCM10007063_05790 [Lentibacillus kapialis]|uniref:Uncharacterized protein n=1 Tax=Lentibacillus kapialis TaxID=340214 RepID=A0A917UUD2_9BACI|nr:hypothetical protein [Lentibacillus kapialis]GGJ86136.1 hypothetical protein GCM10007063_05790 [Lentibacillus kapialis]